MSVPPPDRDLGALEKRGIWVNSSGPIKSPTVHITDGFPELSALLRLNLLAGGNGVCPLHMDTVQMLQTLGH